MESARSAYLSKLADMSKYQEIQEGRYWHEKEKHMEITTCRSGGLSSASCRWLLLEGCMHIATQDQAQGVTT